MPLGLIEGRNQKYVPGVPSNWAVPPVNTTQALDELAAIVPSSNLIAQNSGVPVVTNPTVINFAGAGVTASHVGSGVLVTIPGGGGGGQAANYYVVAQNGNDANSGSWSLPFLTIQAAITAAVAAGGSFTNQWEIIVLPSSTAYGGFTAANGVNVKGLYGNNDGVKINTQITISPDASGLATNSVELSNLNIEPLSGGGSAYGIFLGGLNPGNSYIRNCRIKQNFFPYALSMAQTGSFLTLDNCALISTMVGAQSAL